MTTVMKDIVTWLKQWYYTEDEIDTKLGNKANKNLGTANYNVVTDSSGDITVEAKPTIPSKTSDLTNDGADGTNVFVANNDSRLSDSRTPSSHTHGQVSNDGKITSTAVTVASGDNILITDASDSSKIKRVANLLASHTKDSDANGYTNISSSLTSSSTQADINSAINTKMGDLLDIKFIEITTDKGTASASTMNKLYIETKNSKTDVYYTKRSGSVGSYTYSWEDLDTDILDNLVINWSDVQSKPSWESSTSNIKMNGSVSVGSSGKFVYSDHIHPTDTSKADKTAALGTTVTLVDKGETNEGCIIFNTIS